MISSFTNNGLNTDKQWIEVTAVMLPEYFASVFGEENKMVE